MTDLLDVNLLVSLAWPNHVHHQWARKWFRATKGRRWATTPVTESGFIRVSSNRAAIPTAVSPGDALIMLERLRRVPGHVFLPDDIEGVVGNGLIDGQLVLSYRHVTDAHLLAVARRHGGCLATLDRGIAHLAGQAVKDVVLVPIS